MEVDKQMNLEEIFIKETGERIDNIADATKSLKEAMKHIKNSCNLCGRCNLTKSTCDVAKSYKKIYKAMEELEVFKYQLEKMYQTRRIMK